MKGSGPDSASVALDGRIESRGLHRFSHEAMATVFEVVCAHPDREYASQGAQAAFDLADRLELDLSKFIGNSDISRINHLREGESVRVSPWTMECLQIAQQAWVDTKGAFDISRGTGLERLSLVPDRFEVHGSQESVSLDLGGIGKGYAVDRMVDLLEEWELRRVLVHGGFSSVRATASPEGEEGWPVTLSRPGAAAGGIVARIDASGRALSGSGIQKVDHIVDPRSGEPVRDRVAAWVSVPAADPRAPEGKGEAGGPGASPAAVAEALSTAFMILSPAEIEDLCRESPGLEVWLIPGSPGTAVSPPECLHFPA